MPGGKSQLSSHPHVPMHAGIHTHRRQVAPRQLEWRPSVMPRQLQHTRGSAACSAEGRLDRAHGRAYTAPEGAPISYYLGLSAVPLLWEGLALLHGGLPTCAS